MKKIMLYLLTGILLSFMIPAQVSAQTSCANGGFEDGNFSNWSGKYGDRNMAGIPFDDLDTGFDPGHHAITTSGYDPNIGGTLLSTVGEGNYAIRIGDYDGGAEATVITYSFIVTPANKDFSFRYAMAMQDGNVAVPHEGNENPFFGYYIMSSNIFSPIIDTETYTADNTDPFFTITNGWAWKDWSQKCYDLKKHMGKQVTAIFFVADCVWGGHSAYAYIDGLCSDNGAIADFNIPSEICLEDPLIADGSPSVNEDHHFWSIQESGADWVAVGPEYTQWFPAEHAGVINLKSFIASHGGSLKCDTYYRVKLAVSSECTSWHAETKLIYVRCPEVIEIEDLIFCCDENPDPIIIGPLGSGLTCQWSIQTASLPYFAQIKFGETLEIIPDENKKIVVTVTDEYGCTSTQEFNIWVLGRYEVTIHHCCNNKLTAEINFLDEGCGNFYDLSQAQQAEILSQLEFSWSNGDSGPTIVVDEIGVYTVTVTGLNPCMDASDTYIYTGFAKQSKGNHSF